ncbi:MAG: hypothetical protein B6A08_11370 [Sorangiineae bacterium NIC37A_2]|jgi:sec-independent protein translocase protein TatA|nr:MAG: hypothetical protein B6A08_11370 [Sorangiineae bacterium NIC37A_2]
MGAMSLSHWLIVGFVVVLLFGGNKLAAVGKGLGEGIREFKKGLAGDGSPEEGGPRLSASDRERDEA